MILLELALEAGLNPKWAASTQGGEYKSSCPTCGGKDRFFIQPNKEMRNCKGYYFCRKCETKGDTIQFAKDILGFSFKDAQERVGCTIKKEKYVALKNLNFKKINELVLPPQEWRDKAAALVAWAHQKVLHEPQVLQYLENRGIPLDAIMRCQIGYCPKDLFYDRKIWGLETTDASKKIWLPEGIVVPTFITKGQVGRLKIRRQDYNLTDGFPKYIAIPGSMNGLNIIGNSNNDIMIVVESELDAFALNHSVGDFAFVVAVGSNIKNPDNITDSLAQQKKRVLICHDNDVAGKQMLYKWTHMYSHAKAMVVPVGKDIGEYCEAAGDLRELILKYI